MKIVAYCRYSSELQNPKSCADQEREIRSGLARIGIDAAEAEVIYDSAISGTRTDRDGFDRIRERIRKSEGFLLAVDDQSRFSRLDNSLSLITDLVCAGGRFVSVCEQIDTSSPGWKLKVRVMELHHGTCSDETGSRVRRGQRGRVLDGKSAGDFGYGYESFAIDPEYARSYCGRGPKPAMGIRIDRMQAQWVTWIFQQFNEGRSINWIAREMTRQNVVRHARAKTRTWFAPTIRAMLSNAKYVGVWTWGKNRVVRDSGGRTKQIPAPKEEVIEVERPELRIMSQELWEQTQERLAKLRQRTGHRPGEKRRNPIVHYTKAYPTDVLMTLLVCGYCGGKMHYAGSGRHIYRQCVNSIDGRDSCKEKLRIPAAKARAVLLGFVARLLAEIPEWVAKAVEEMGAAIKEFHQRVPAQLERVREQLLDAERRCENLLLIAESGGVADVEEFKQRLRAAGEEAKQLRAELHQIEAMPITELQIPDEKWVRMRLQELAKSLESDEASVARLLRELIGEIQVFRILPIGKKRGYQQLRFRINVWNTVREAYRGNLPEQILELADRQRPAEGDLSPEFVLDVGGPHRLDKLAPYLAELRANGLSWIEIARRTGISMDLAYKCWRRYTKALAKRKTDPRDCDYGNSDRRTSDDQDAA